MAPIVQRISLEGGDQVVSTLQAIGAQGQKALQNIQDAVNGTNFSKVEGHLKVLGESAKTTLTTIENAAKKLAAVFGITLGAGIAGLGASLLALAKSGVSAVGALNGLSKATGSTVEEMNALVSVFAKAGVDSDQLGNAFKHLAVRTQEAFDDIKKSIKEAADVAAKNQINIQDSALGVQQAQLNLRKAYEEVQKAGTSGIAGEQALLNLQQARIAVSKAYLSQSEAQRKANEDQANSVESLVDAVEALSRGEALPANINATPANLFKGLVASAGPGLDALKSLQGNLTEISATAAPATIQVLYKVADIFKNLKDETLKTALAQQIFGRDVDIGLVKALSKGSAAIRQEQVELDRLGLSFRGADAEAVAGFKESFRTLENYIGLIKQKIGVAFAPLFKEVVESLTTLLTGNVDKIKTFFNDAKDAVVAIIAAITNTIKGVKFEDFAKGSKLKPEQLIDVKEWQATFEHIRDVAKEVGKDIGIAFAVLREIMNGVAEAINKVFGTKFTGDELGIVLLIGQFTGLNAAIVGVIGTVVQLATAAASLAAFVGWPALLAAAFVAAAVIIYKNWDNIVAAAKTAKDGILAVFGSIGDFFKGIGTAIYDFFKGIFEGVVKMGKAALDFLRSLFGSTGKPAATAGTAPEAAGGGAVPVAVEKASGGLISGPGTGTSDSILARLSAGEYVVKASAVRNVGVGFLHALNSAPGYALGGLVDGLRDSLAGVVPRFAGGGLAPSGGALRPFTLVLPGGASYGGMFARESAVGSLRRASVSAQVSSTGRRPGWVR